jgi:competence ComEA-like helix-hairpin-helix protein
MHWKDLFYFNKNEKTVVILLLLLVVCTALLHVVASGNSVEASESELKSMQEFSDFQSSLHPVYYRAAADRQSDLEPYFPQAKTKKAKDRKLQPGAFIDINAAGASAFKRLPGVGDSIARRIALYRDALGGFAEIDQLCEVKGISQSKLEKIAPFCTLKRQHKQINLNSATTEQLHQHPYISAVQAAQIVAVREVEPIGDVNTLKRLKIFTKKELERLNPYITLSQ